MAAEQVFGIHAVEGVLKRRAKQVDTLFMDNKRKDKRLQSLEVLARKKGVNIQYCPTAELDQMAPPVSHQGVCITVSSTQTKSESFLDELLTSSEKPLFLLVLDGVTDPHNMGACLRTADGAGVDAVIAPKDRACGLNATVSKVASGAAESVPFIQVTNLARTLSLLKDAGIWLIGTALEENSQSIYQTDFTGPLAIVMGAEGKGLRRLTQELCDQLIYLPMAGDVQSLNVSVATGVTLYEAVRQRGAS